MIALLDRNLLRARKETAWLSALKPTKDTGKLFAGN
jgi:hypothetical protein